MNSYTLEQLEKETGVTRRQIRYYISEKLLPGPVSQGRNASYTEVHLKGLRDIKRLRDADQSIAAIRNQMALVSRCRVIPLTKVVREEFEIAVDVRVSVRVGVSVKRKRRILEALDDFSQALLVITNVNEEGRDV